MRRYGSLIDINPSGLAVAQVNGFSLQLMIFVVSLARIANKRYFLLLHIQSAKIFPI